MTDGLPTEHSEEVTPARVGIGRVGGSMPTAARLRLLLDHARARDAVRHAFDAAGMVAALTATGRAAVAVTSAAGSRDEYVRRPDLGRALVGRRRHRAATCGRGAV